MFGSWRNRYYGNSYFGSKLAWLFATPFIFFGGVFVSEYQKPDSFVRANTDKVLVFFMSTYAGKLILSPQKYEHCITNANANTPPSEVMICFIKD